LKVNMALSRPRKAALSPDLSARKPPAQQRSTETYERILEIAAITLADVGIERLSTNLVCQRAGLTPPALYRYFPNKYALLCELGRRLMQQQNEVVPRWITPNVFNGSIEDLEHALAGLFLDTYRVTDAVPGGVWILRALRAVPSVQQVRLESHAQVSEAQGQLLREAFPDVPQENLTMIGRIAVEMIYAGVELLFDEKLDPEAVAQVIAGMVASRLTRIRSGM
jgi:AcrR family transcriptional regulator